MTTEEFAGILPEIVHVGCEYVPSVAVADEGEPSSAGQVSVIVALVAVLEPTFVTVIS